MLFIPGKSEKKYNNLPLRIIGEYLHTLCQHLKDLMPNKNLIIIKIEIQEAMYGRWSSAEKQKDFH